MKNKQNNSSDNTQTGNQKHQNPVQNKSKDQAQNKQNHEEKF